MKKLLIAISFVSLVGCGLVEDMGRQCGGSLEEVCHMIFGYNSTDIKQNESDIEELKKRLLALELQINSSIAAITELQFDVDSGAVSLAEVEGQIGTLQSIATTTQADIIQLQSEDRVVEYIDPCGDGPGFDEIILRTSSNKLVVFFESGNRRFLTLLVPGNFRTTDQDACDFRVNADLTITDL